VKNDGEKVESNESSERKVEEEDEEEKTVVTNVPEVIIPRAFTTTVDSTDSSVDKSLRNEINKVEETDGSTNEPQQVVTKPASTVIAATGDDHIEEIVQELPASDLPEEEGSPVNYKKNVCSDSTQAEEGTEEASMCSCGE